MVRFSEDTSQIREASIISAIAVLLSFALTGSLYILFFGFDERFWGAMALAITVPWGISIPLNFYMSKQRRKVTLVAMRLKEARRKLRDANKKLEHKASYDGLTGLFNREYFLAEFDKRRMASGDNVFLIVDADHFNVLEVLNRSAKHVAPDTAEAVDTNLDRHLHFLQWLKDKT